ncbi:MAG: DSD1 family PLP-dependent enzyme [Betaproteobacteria bacterium]|nr:DSD1 family PLP-dependent enzyme [Betaproteobacteria bacterium]
MQKTAATLAELDTPCLVLDAARMRRNIARLKARLAPFGVRLRPHLKTPKCIEVARELMETPQGPATVSTLKEAEQFAAAGVKDILYAVCIAPHKLARAGRLRAAGVDLTLVVDSVPAAQAVAAHARATRDRIPALLQIASDGHRSGVRPADDLLVEIGRALQDGAELRGVMTHAGASYDLHGAAALAEIAEQERRAAVSSAERLRAAGLPCPVVSVGSTPTAHFARDLSGVSEVRAGVFVFFDLVQAGIGVCTPDDVALSVLASVIGHQKEKGWIITDAGWMAMSRDRGTAKQAVDQGYGMVCDAEGRPYADLIVADANQEHGVLALRRGSRAALPDLPVGALVRILPNHACATGAQHERYHVLDGGSNPVAEWRRFSGW